MQHSQRLDQRLHVLREEVRTMTQEKERGEGLWRERLQRCQRQLKAKEEEMSRQSQYFENFKAQLQHKLSLARDREQSLQNRIYSLENQLLDVTVSAATGMATVRAAKITAGTANHLVKQERITSTRGEGEGEEEKKDERRNRWQPDFENECEERWEEDDRKAEPETEGGRNRDTKQSSNEARLQGFIISMKEDLRVLLEREENGMTERRGLMEQLQEAQENCHLLGCKVEEMKADVHQLKLSESLLMEEVDELREENQRLQKIFRDAANQTPLSSTINPESTRISPRTSPAVCSTSSNTLSHTSAKGQSVKIAGKVQSHTDAEPILPHPLAVSPVDHQREAECRQDNTDDCNSVDKAKDHLDSKCNTSFQPLSFVTETLNEFKMGCVNESPSAESNALREAFWSLGLGEDLQALQEQREHLEAALQHTQEQLRAMAKENAQLRSQLRKEAEEQQTETEHWSTKEKIATAPDHDVDDHPASSSTQDDGTVAQNNLVQALNQENRALAERIQELISHMRLREEEIKEEQRKLHDSVTRLKGDGIRLEQENHEQSCLILELTRKTEDDLNTIMELQQKLEELRGTEEELQGQKPEVPEMFVQKNQEEFADSIVTSVPQEVQNSQIEDVLSTASLPGCNHKSESLQDYSQNIMTVSSLTDQTSQLTSSIKNLPAEQEELTKSLNLLRDQLRDVALSVQTQTEEKQQLTRTVWALKEQKDGISQSLAGLKQEKEQQSRAVHGLKDERDQFIRSMSGLKEEKEQLTKSLSGLQRDKEAIIKTLSSGSEERDRIMESLQGLQAESDQLKQTVLHLKEQRDKLTDSLKCLTEQREQEQLSQTSKDDHDRLEKAVSSLTEEKGKIEHSVNILKEEQKQIMQIILGLREERNRLQALPIQTQTEEKNPKQPLIKLQEELDKSHVEIQRLHIALSQAEVKWEEAEMRAAQTSEQVERLTDAANEMEDTTKKNDRLATQVTELQIKLTELLREKTHALSLKKLAEERCGILTAELKAKLCAAALMLPVSKTLQTVALEELNSEYIALKGGKGSRDEGSTALFSLRTRYNNIRAKYDVLLRRKNLKDLDVAPLKAKLSCLLVKCQERNSLLAQMMRAMHRHGCVDSQLTQRVEDLLSDAALQDYSAAFAPGGRAQTRRHCEGFTQEFIPAFLDYTNGFVADQTGPLALTSVSKKQNAVPHGSGDQWGQSAGHTSVFARETIHRQSSSGFMPLAEGTSKKNSPGPTLAEDKKTGVPKPAGLQVKGSLIPIMSQMSPVSRSLQAISPPQRLPSDPTILSVSSPSIIPPSSSTPVSLNRRFSSPEKIVNLHEQLQKTLMSSFQTPGSRGRGQQPKRSLSLSASTDPSPPKAELNPSSCSAPHSPSLPFTTALSPAQDVVKTKSASFNTSGTLLNAVAVRSANAALSPVTFICQGLKASKSSALSRSSNDPLTTVAPSKDESISNGGFNLTGSPKQLKKGTVISDVSDSEHTASAFLTLTTAPFDRHVTNPKSTHPNVSASSKQTVSNSQFLNNASKTNDPSSDGRALTTACSQSAHSSDERSNQSAREANAAPERFSRPKPEPPAEVRSVEVIKTVGQSSLLIGWERPPLDELGCSNGTFVYGYRVYADGNFHKSVMSSACTKCILESVDLSVPVHISVQTLGSNGLCSSSVHTVHGASNTTGQR
ncbi:uncharacterized protein ACNS7B_011938 isoform 1-T3 [Menidia menidia]